MERVRELELVELVELAVSTLVLFEELSDQYPNEDDIPEALLKFADRLEEIADEYRAHIGDTSLL